jgi:dTMP kinase
MFITFEGGEGSGKSTAIKHVVETLTKEGYQIVLTREPGGTPISEEIRNVILDKKNTAMDPKTEAFFMPPAVDSTSWRKSCPL